MCLYRAGFRYMTMMRIMMIIVMAMAMVTICRGYEYEIDKFAKRYITNFI